MVLHRFIGTSLILALLLSSCSFSTSFKAGGKGKDIVASSILIPTFSNNAAQGPTSLSQDLTDEIREYYQSNTKLIVNSNGNSDLELFGTIEDFYAKQVASSLSEDGTAEQMELFVVLKIEYIDNNNSENSTSERITQSSVYQATSTLEEAQEDLLPDLIDLLAQQVFNKTVAKW